MTTPARKAILDNLQTTFEAITTGNGYRTTITKVQPLARGYADVKTGERPFIGYVAGQESIEFQPFDLIRSTLNMSIIGHVSGASQADRSTKLNNLIIDIPRALNTDTTRGTNAIKTTVVSYETDEGDPDAKGDGSVLMNIAIVYERSATAS